MKKLILFLFLFISYLSYSQSYIEVYNGDLPIIVTCSHGGSIRTTRIDNRNCEIYECNSDLYTNDIGFKIRKYLDNTCFFVLNNLHRVELDPNRNVSEACNDADCETYYDMFHYEIENIIRLFTNQPILILDIHGQAHEHGFIELGYNIDRKDYYNNINHVANSSVNNYYGKTIEEIVRGKYSLGYYYDRYYDVSPSPKNPIPPTPYFNGGYITEKYSKYKNVIVIQIEIPYSIRKSEQSREEFSKITAKIIKSYYKKLK
ncbi:hypothetical protein KC669_02830 [Candidatus Dojkabacteria bacterium]|uniref:N-formylglutamate amidohydrolase n=1 Tax=Candidatus Dojkabacteria bacterium TaxID=2099670 RepID=A0A955LA98_9BACT|nr:hypothetical protein [Candidatus Dojkabacteria bacterium]